MGKMRLRKSDRVKMAPKGNKAIYVYGSKKRVNKIFGSKERNKR